MFTGIVTDIGTVENIEPVGGLRRFTIACSSPADSIAIGASIAHAGVCLTVTTRQPTATGSSFTVDVSTETLARTTLGDWAPGKRINLERALKVGDELGGHVVTGHVDGVARIISRDDTDGGTVFTVEAPEALARFIAEKGSVALDGTSLTVNGVTGNRFSLTLIPHTLAVTTWGAARPGDALNIEVDMMARYAARLAEASASGY